MFDDALKGKNLTRSQLQLPVLVRTQQFEPCAIAKDQYGTKSICMNLVWLLRNICTVEV